MSSLRVGQELEIVSFIEGIPIVPFHKIFFPTIVSKESACFRHLYFRTSVGGLISLEGWFSRFETSADGTGGPTDRERLEEESLKVEGKRHVIRIDMHVAEKFLVREKLSIKLVCADRIMTQKISCVLR